MNERILNGMSTSPQSGAAELYPACPPIAPAEQQTPERTFDRRSFGKIVISGAVTAVTYAVPTIAVLKTVDDIYTKLRWPAGEPYISPADGAENIPPGGDEHIVFMGYGQNDATNAANQLFNALGRTTSVSAMHYPNQGFTCRDLAPVIAQRIRERRPARLNIVGVSMGTDIGLESARLVVLQDKRRPGHTITKEDQKQERQSRINYLVAYSSPSKMEDAFQGEIADTIVAISDRLHYSGDAAGKLLYDMVDQHSNHPLYAEGLSGIFKMARNCISEVNNDCSPEMALSQLKILMPFNFANQATQYSPVFDPFGHIIYIAPQVDSIVDGPRAARDYEDGSRRSHLGFTLLSSGNTNHANTADSALAYGHWRKTQTA